MRQHTTNRQRLAIAALSLLLLFGAVAAARAQDVPTVPDDPASAIPDPYATGEQAASDNELPDTDYTPNAEKDSGVWSQVGGAQYGEPAVDPDSTTAFSDQLFDVAFPSDNVETGFAGGSTCLKEPIQREGESDQDFGLRVEDCEQDDGSTSPRVPVLYRYSNTPDRGLVWERVDLPGSSAPGYIGSIAWSVATGDAIAVGGTGTYPRREPAFGKDIEGAACPTEGAGSTRPYGSGEGCDQAGKARAWLFHDGRWTELTADLPPEMTGLTAVDLSAIKNLGFAGGLGQIWRWQGPGTGGGAFDKRYDMNSPPADLAYPKRFVFRVRELRIAPSLDPPRALAVTDGCCAEDPLRNAPTLLAYEADFQPGKWYARRLDPAESTVLDTAGVDLGPGDEGRRRSGRQDIPDSFYSLTMGLNPSFPENRVSVLATPGGASDIESPEKPSIVTAAFCITHNGGHFPQGAASSQLLVPDQGVEALRSRLQTARLVSGDGDIGGAFGYQLRSPGEPPADVHGTLSQLSVQGTGGCSGTTGGFDKPDGVADWVVGELRSTKRPGLGSQALAYSTVTRPTLAPDVINHDPTPAELASGRYEPTSREKLEAYLRSQYFLLPSYALNSIDVIGETGAGWAVGDHGAILQLTDSQQGGGGSIEPEPPRLGAHSSTPLPDDGPYQGTRPSSVGVTGTVPSLRSMSRQSVPEPHLVATGSPDPTRPSSELTEDVAQIVMSRDGQEGWAIGPTEAAQLTSTGIAGATTTLYHYDGSSWVRCDMMGVPHLLPPDRRCAELAPLRSYTNTLGRLAPVRMIAAARVPLENDADPANDDEFEVIAIGSEYRESPQDPQQRILLRYRDGRWRVDTDPATRAVLTSIPAGFDLIGMAFIAPDDGWVLSETQAVLHYDGERWVNCTQSIAAGHPEDCADPGGYLSFGGTGTDPDTAAGIVSTGDRVFLYGSRTLNGTRYPMIIHHQRGGSWAAAAPAGYDPVHEARQGDPAPSASQAGTVSSLAVAAGSGDSVHGWAVGRFESSSASTGSTGATAELPPQTSLMRLMPEEGWRPFDDQGPVRDYLAPALNDVALSQSAFAREGTGDRLQLTMPGGPDSLAVIAQRTTGRMFRFDHGRRRWELLPADRPLGGIGRLDGPVQALAPDGQGGFWAGIKGEAGPPEADLPGHVDFFHYTDRPPAEVFEEAASPLKGPEESFTALAGSADGTVWAATRSDRLYRYDRVTGWDSVRINGWDPGRVVTRPSKVLALAVGPDGRGVAVGEGGRIAQIGPRAVSLDAAAGVVCESPGQGPCGTGRDLSAASVASDGSAMVGGEQLSLLWRPGGGEFHPIERPTAPRGADVSAISMPAPGRAWLATDTGQVYAGTEAGGHWSWRLDVLDHGRLITLDEHGSPLPVRGLAVDVLGHGFAVGDRGLLLERDVGSGEWRRVRTPFLDDFTAVTLPAAGGGGALIGGRNGLVLTQADGQFELARAADRFSLGGESTGPVIGMALLPGSSADLAEAWVATAGSEGSGDGNAAVARLLHYSSDGGDPVLNPDRHAMALPDVPAPREGEIAFAAIGKSDCHLPEQKICPPMEGATQDYEVVMQRIAAELAGRAGQPGAPRFAVFTGDATDTAGTPGYATAEPTADLNARNTPVGSFLDAEALNGARKQRRWRELFAEGLEDGGVPLLGAVGGQDLASVPACYGSTGCVPARSAGDAGDNLSWRQSFAATPWGGGDEISADDLSLIPVSGGSSTAIEAPGTEVDPDGDGPLRKVDASTGGAHTHYAYDVTRGGEKVARLVFVDTSLRALAAGDPFQNPLEGEGGQTAWLDRMTCIEGAASASGAPCTRERTQQAIVISNTPTYSYGPGGLTDTDVADGTQLEAILLQNRVNAVISGRLGWNGLYYATAPGVHCPQPGGTYPSGPPSTTDCQQAPDGSADPVASALQAKSDACETATQTGVPDPTGCAAGAGESLVGQALPFVVASGAGGKFGPDGNATGSAAEGFWHGYTVVRLDPGGDARGTIVEQRPILDWVSVTANRHVVRAGGRLTLTGLGREPIGATSNLGSSQATETTRFDEISTPAITHRFELLQADPDRPWLPKQDAGSSDDATEPRGAATERLGESDPCGRYLCLDPKVATINDQSGEVRAGKGQYPRTFAIAQLSVGEKSATYPLVFEPRASFRAPAPPPPVPVAVPAPPPPPAAAPPTTPQVNLPAAPVLPVLTAQALAPPPIPPSPPTFASEAPLDLNISPAALDVTPPTAVSQPPTPPVNPAPPSGARREARQRQAAAQKSGADSEPSEGAEDAGDAHGRIDSADNPNAAMTRHEATAVDRSRPGPSFTPATHAGQPSAWTRDLLLGGGLGIAALVLALGLGTARPTPRRRQPEAPAPAFSRVHTRGRRRD